MDEFYNKHYITIDENNYIIKGFSDAFKQPTEDDICINEQGNRHFELLGQVNPALINDGGKALYKYADGQVVETTEEERHYEIVHQKTELEQLQEIVDMLLLDSLGV